MNRSLFKKICLWIASMTLATCGLSACSLAKDTQVSEKNLSKDEIPVVESQNLSAEQLAYTYKEDFEDIKLLNEQGEEVMLSSFKGKNIVLVFWASWCPDCQRELPILQEVYDQYKEREDLQFVLVNLVGKRKTREETASSGGEYLKAKGFTLPNYRDMTQASRESYELKNIPTTILYDKEGKAQILSLTPEGKEAYCYVGEIPKDVLVQAIERVLQKK